MTNGRRHRRSSGWKRKAWALYFRPRIRAGLEHCRFPGCENVATRIGHLRPAVTGGTYHRQNLAIVCDACDAKMGVDDWTGAVETVEQSFSRRGLST